MRVEIPRPLLWTLAAGGLGLSLSAAAGEFQSHASILETAESLLAERAAQAHQGRVEITSGRLDRRLRLKVCDRELQAFMPSGARLNGNTSVGVRCDGSTPWTVYVSASVKVFGKAIVASAPLIRGAALAPDQVSVVEREISGLSYGYYDSAGEIEGLIVKRAVPAGTVITPNMLTAPQLIERGDRVTLVAGKGPINVRMRGEAMSDGAKGDRVRVRTLNRKRVIEGWVVSRGVVKVTL